MKKCFLFLLFSIFIFSIVVHAQAPNGAPTIEQFVIWVDDSYSNFDQQVRTLGFKFEKKDESKDGETDYFYNQKIERNAVYYTDRIIFKVLHSGKSQAIQYITSQADLINYFTPKLTANSFQSKDCAAPDAENEITMCYSTATHTAVINNKMQEKTLSSIEIIQNK